MHRLPHLRSYNNHPERLQQLFLRTQRSLAYQTIRTTYSSPAGPRRAEGPCWRKVRGTDRDAHSSSVINTFLNSTPSPSPTPNNAIASKDTYVLTLSAPSSHVEFVTTLRKKYAAPNETKLAAQIVLFNALPASELPTIEADIHRLCARTSPFGITTREPFLSPNHRVSINCPSLGAWVLRKTLSSLWTSFLCEGNKRRFLPQYTIRSRLTPARAVRIFAEMREIRTGGIYGEVNGLVLWREEQRCWTVKKEFPFMQQRDISADEANYQNHRTGHNPINGWRRMILQH